ncbi:hypothetical protein SAMN05216226_107129 [Halovenus aranensis]|uniref:Cytochrome C and Quinol oxidase polypeptide I n=1 Tax=Halovenus aranensis TaxID=890420 RepID=A0A1G8VS34_9EURY|nr:hypothetical protein [Halovenus aranensis]SDJ68908.1 hypothetical protein SAMN05216226_107129 [Halovenus aranensis]
MSAIPGTLDTAQQPPMTVPLRHFFVALGFLFAGVGVGVAWTVDAVPGLGRLAHVHLLLAGWVCLTIMGAMTQFVPVWSGTDLHSRTLASVQLGLVTVGLAGFAVAFLTSALPWLVAFGGVLLAGFWVFVYNIGRTLTTVDGYDVTEGHFLFALCCFLLLTVLGLALAVNLDRGVLSGLPVTHGGVRGAHVTLAVFGAVLTTIYGALYQLGTMFTQTALHDVDHHLQTAEEVGHPVGVVLLAAGRLLDWLFVARLGAVLLLVAALAVATVLGRKLVETQVEVTPMHRRYAVGVLALTLWALVSLPEWVRDPTDPTRLFGAEGAAHLLVVGFVGFIVLGTLYHVVPFVVWVHRYSDLLGFEDVPMIDDLYDDRVAAADFALTLSGTALLAGTSLVGGPQWLVGLGGVLLILGLCAVLANLLLVVRRHSPHTLDQIVLGSLTPRRADGEDRAEQRS